MQQLCVNLKSRIVYMYYINTIILISVNAAVVAPRGPMISLSRSVAKKGAPKIFTNGKIVAGSLPEHGARVSAPLQSLTGTEKINLYHYLK